jgi:hypothetical protein
MIGARCADFDTEAVVSMEKPQLKIYQECHAHPTLQKQTKLPWLQIINNTRIVSTIFTLKKPVKLYLMGFLFKILEVSI